MTLIGFGVDKSFPSNVFAHQREQEKRNDHAFLARQARKNIAAQAELFDPRNHLFGDPAWTIMLFLFECACLGSNASVTDTCAAACAAPTTGLRYISALERVGYVKRTPDPHDRRRSHVALSEEAADRMAAYFEVGSLAHR